MTSEQAHRNAEILSNVVGKTVTFKVAEWDESRKRFRECYVGKAVSVVEVEYEPTSHVTFKFSDGSSMDFFSLDEFDKLEGGGGEYGSIYAMLEFEGFSMEN